MKRRGRADTNGESEAHHAKRRKDEDSSSDVDMAVDEPAPSLSVKELGLMMMQTVRSATKDGRPIATVFLKKPSKKEWPDYYVLIEHPIGLDDIKKRIEANKYATLEAIRQDFELCFTNAKKYNLKESDIYSDAKDLLKLTNKTYNKMIPEGAIGEKSKTPSMSRILKGKLQQLCEISDEQGRPLITEFMQLPSRKEWAYYYDMIKEPQCIENIFKKLKKKAYPSALDFAKDVELIFSNAMTFNTENSDIWVAAETLRDAFREIVSDLPEPHNLPRAYWSPTAQQSKPKVVIKMPAASSSSAPPREQTLPDPPKPRAIAQSNVQQLPKLHLKPLPPPKEPSPEAETPPPPPVRAAAPAPSLPVAPATVPSLPVAPATALPKAKANAATPQPATVPPPSLPTPTAAVLARAPQPKAPVAQPVPKNTFINSVYSHYPNASYAAAVAAAAGPLHAPIPVVAPRAVAPAAATQTVIQSQSLSSTPAPDFPLSHQLKSISFKVANKRRYSLDHTHGKSWAFTLSNGEHQICVEQITFMAEDGDETSSEDDEEEEEEDVDMEPEAAEKKAPVKRGRGRPPKNKPTFTARTPKPKLAKSRKKKIGEVEVRLNGTGVSGQEELPGSWAVDIPVGVHTLEIGEKDGMIWKVFLLRQAIIR